ncbi:11-beta-hydroxysteroid dehydrogenase-like 2 [Eumeta japonica]|uniref:11-beta-hydroxysteroid dehydrogenase-like 2 n=1 Tax=Eumeta variegata TaxID=151549 RepID=A0A4C1Z971_EUMVA|nr:11-beta-hydroxysteroid dehydrogenase-like 2 [Eumeta japonica]
MSFENKVVIVTGSSSGIGASTAILFAREGAKVTITGRNVEKLNKVEKEIVQLTGNKPLVIAADISKEDDAMGIVIKTVSHFEKLDVLVNNPGVATYRSIFDSDYLTEFDRVVATNLRAVATLTYAAMPHLVKTKGNIVNVTGIAAVSPGGIMGHCCAAKAGFDHFSRSVASETSDFTDEDVVATAKQMPLGFMTETEEVGELILFLVFRTINFSLNRNSHQLLGLEITLGLARYVVDALRKTIACSRQTPPGQLKALKVQTLHSVLKSLWESTGEYYGAAVE